MINFPSAKLESLQNYHFLWKDSHIDEPIRCKYCDEIILEEARQEEEVCRNCELKQEDYYYAYLEGKVQSRKGEKC